MFEELTQYMATLHPISTHTHYLPESFFQDGYGLTKLLENSYCRRQWRGVSENASLEEYLRAIRHRGVFVWLERSLQQIYGIDEPLNAATYSMYDEEIKRTYQKNHSAPHAILQQKAKFQRMILDAHWNPGDNNGKPDFFAPTFRIDSFLTGLDPSATTYDGNNYLKLYGNRFCDFDSFFSEMEAIVSEKIAAGAVALKCAAAYDRGLDFALVSDADARAAYEKPASRRTAEDDKCFQDYTFLRLCRLAAKLNVPMQVHTGLAKMYRTNALQLQPMIAANPNTRFSLFHGSYPWTSDISGLAQAYPVNVLPDFVWLPLLSTEAAIRLLTELLDAGSIDCICWGDDTWTSEECYGAFLAMQFVLATVLSKKVEDGVMTKMEAFDVARRILVDNAKQIYAL